VVALTGQDTVNLVIKFAERQFVQVITQFLINPVACAACADGGLKSFIKSLLHLTPIMTMKYFVRLFFKTLRIILGPVILLREFLTRPKGIVRSPALQTSVDQQCENLVLYHYKTCPFCMKVRQEIRRLSLKIEHLDAQQEGKNRADLVRDGGRAKVPCLKITDQAGDHQWLFDSEEIMKYLRGRFAIV